MEKAKPINVSAEQLSELLTYNGKTGVLKWKHRELKWFKGTVNRSAEHTRKIWNLRYANQEAGSINKSTNTRRVQLVGGQQEASRIAFFMATGLQPEHVSHRNKNNLDNRLVNLIASDHTTNTRNRIPTSRTKSGVVGVSWFKNNKTWKAAISRNAKRIDLGYHKNFFEACCARKSAENRLGYMKNLPDN